MTRIACLKNVALKLAAVPQLMLVSNIKRYSTISRTHEYYT
jgi:hypothetical protein